VVFAAFVFFVFVAFVFFVFAALVVSCVVSCANTGMANEKMIMPANNMDRSFFMLGLDLLRISSTCFLSKVRANAGRTPQNLFKLLTDKELTKLLKGRGKALGRRPACEIHHSVWRTHEMEHKMHDKLS